VRFTALHRRLLLIALMALALTGLAWTALDLAYGIGPVEDPSPQLAKAWLSRLHGALAMAALVALGSVLPLHMPAGWRARAHLASGLSVVLLAASLVASGYLLYYAADEGLRWLSVYAHIAAGIAVCFLFAIHWFASAQKRQGFARLVKTLFGSSA
jgi:type IV secretory pathway VirB2 component (pilin)